MTKTNPKNLPTYLKEHGNFCVWKYVERDGKVTKPPYDAHYLPELVPAKVNEPTTFMPFSSIITKPLASVDGLGVRITEPLVGIDIDHCYINGKLDDRARDIVDTLETYTEFSPSGEGIRLFILAPGFSYDSEKYLVKGDGLEIYAEGMTNRYLTVTGLRYNSYEIMEGREAELMAVIERYMPRAVTSSSVIMPLNTPAAALSLSDADLIGRARRANDGVRFSALYDNSGWGAYREYQKDNGEPDHSKADLALCTMLAFWAGGDSTRIDTMFRNSGLYRSKWDSSRMVGGSKTTYGAITIAKAISACTTFYNPDGYKKAMIAEGKALPQERRPEEVPAVVAAPAPAGNQATAPAPAPIQKDRLESFFEKIQSQAYKPMATGLTFMDNLLDGGLLPQTVSLILAAPATGKTALCMQWAEAMARKKIKVVYLCFEMSYEQLIARALSLKLAESGKTYTTTQILQGWVWQNTPKDKKDITTAYENYREESYPYITYNPDDMTPDGMTANLGGLASYLTQIGNEARTRGENGPTIFIDYLHLLYSDGVTDDKTLIKNAMKVLKDYAIAYNAAVVAIGAINRTSNGNITMFSGRDSSNVEYGADNVLSLNYWEIDNGNAKIDNAEDMERLEGETPRRITCRLLKARLSKNGKKKNLYYNSACNYFYDDMETRFERSGFPVVAKQKKAGRNA